MSETRDEILVRHDAEIKELQEVVASLINVFQEQTAGDGWDEPLDGAVSGDLVTDVVTDSIAVQRDGDTYDVVFPVATPEQTEKREAMLEGGLFKGYKGDYDHLRNAYLKAGPLWLHAYDRAYMVSLPAEWRYQMGVDVQQTDPERAADLASDILKPSADEKFMRAEDREQLANAD